MKNDRKPLTALTLEVKNLSRREIFCAKQDAVKALKVKRFQAMLDRFNRRQSILMARQAKALKFIV